MNFYNDFRAALQAGQDFDALMELVRRHRLQGLTVDGAYKTLHQMWLDYGFDRPGEVGELQDNLESVMQKVWYGRPVVQEGV